MKIIVDTPEKLHLFIALWMVYCDQINQGILLTDVFTIDGMEQLATVYLNGNLIAADGTMLAAIDLQAIWTGIDD